MKLEDSLEMKVINIMKQKLQASLQGSKTKMAVLAGLFETLPLVMLHVSVVIEI